MDVGFVSFKDECLPGHDALHAGVYKHHGLCLNDGRNGFF
jgi:hypothetical protein